MKNILVRLENKNTMNKEDLDRNEKIVNYLLMTIVFLMPSLVSAEPWDDMADGILNLLTNGFTRTIAIIVCIGLGFAAWAGKLTWGIAGKFIGGVVFIFGATAIVDFFIGTVV